MSAYYSWTITFFFIVSCTSEVTIDADALQALAKLPGKIGITLKTGSNEWHAVIENGIIRGADSNPKALPQATTALRTDFEPPYGVPPVRGLVYWGPYLASPNGNYVAASLAKERHAAGAPSFAIVSKMFNKAVVVHGEENAYIRSLAWSPDSNYIAVLRASSELTALDRLILTIFGHADPKMRWSLDIVDVNGILITKTRIKTLRGSWGWVVWIQ
jgi:hypothetical protein